MDGWMLLNGTWGLNSNRALRMYWIAQPLSMFPDCVSTAAMEAPKANWIRVEGSS